MVDPESKPATVSAELQAPKVPLARELSEIASDRCGGEARVDLLDFALRGS